MQLFDFFSKLFEVIISNLKFTKSLKFLSDRFGSISLLEAKIFKVVLDGSKISSQADDRYGEGHDFGKWAIGFEHVVYVGGAGQEEKHECRVHAVLEIGS